MATIFEFLSKDGNITPEKVRKSRQMQFHDKTAYVWGLRYRWDPSLSMNPVRRFAHFMPPWFQMEWKFHFILQNIGRTLEKNAEERAEILQRISDNKITSDKKDRDIEKEIADVKNVQQELRSFQESFSCQVFWKWTNSTLIELSKFNPH